MLLNRVFRKRHSDVLTFFHVTEVLLVVVGEGAALVGVVLVSAGLLSVSAVGVAHTGTLRDLLRVQIQTELLPLQHLVRLLLPLSGLQFLPLSRCHDLIRSCLLVLCR